MADKDYVDLEIRTGNSLDFSFSMLQVRDPNPGCGLRDYEGVLAQYSGILTMSSRGSHL